jgi:DNA-binding transcriptional LysR family regulator
MDIQSITYFVAAAESMSFTAAARSLYVSQPSISKKIAELEAELGLTLFNRNGKSIQLTAAGQQLYYDFKTMLQFIDEVTIHAKDISNSITGSVCIGVPQHMDLTRSIPGFYKMFYQNNPGIKIILKYFTRRMLMNSFLEGQTDCTFFLSFDAEHLQNEISINKYDLPKGPHRLLYSPSLFPAGFEPSLESFEDKTFLFYKGADDTYSITGKSDDVLESVGINPGNKLWLDSLDAVLYYISEGLGVSVVGPSFRIEKSDMIQWLPILNDKSMVNMCLCWKESNENSAFITFIKALKKWCENIH